MWGSLRGTHYFYLLNLILQNSGAARKFLSIYTSKVNFKLLFKLNESSNILTFF